MATDYHQRLTPVIRHLEKHFNDPLNLEEVAKLACLSPYHFHRIFKAVTGETLNDYLRRLRLEQAANALFYKKPAITAVALEFGFSSSQSLAKAFKQYFNLTPSQIRQCDTIESFSMLLKDSKIGHSLRKIGHDSNNANSYTAPDPTQRSNTMNNDALEIKNFDSCQLAYVRVTGPYGENYEPAIGKLYGWAGPNGQAGNTNIFIYHDNPEITPDEKCRTDICLFIDNNTDVGNGIETKAFPGGKYAVVRTMITDKSHYASAWDSLMSQIVEQGIDSDDRPCFELYHSYDHKTGHADVSFCSAIR
ncbi:AraC family transcriptional regulator [Vibrio sp. ZSDE26]|uniref:AraC family transcriptional regulator n=1 Tax=Vibrio amylolyticus TaxID=2847292 RepID=A0A9X1XK93_9VIBR|nr:AraC family transcriptional regulator [Vibrio amylolyticus]MCK6264271.1 AraC family transcriptional regulator [Vibrio amylolyticus]